MKMFTLYMLILFIFTDVISCIKLTDFVEMFTFPVSGYIRNIIS